MRSSSRAGTRSKPAPAGSDVRATRVRLLRIAADTPPAEGAGEELRQPGVVGVAEREARDEDAVGALERAQDGIAHLGLGAVALVVHAPVGQPHRRRTEHGARLPILLAARQRRFALCREPAARVPPSGRRLEAGSHARTVSSSTAAPRRAHDAIDAPSESTPSSRCGETTTIRFPRLGAGWDAATTPYDRALARRSSREQPPLRPAGRPHAAPPRARQVRRVAAPTPSVARRPASCDADRPELGLRARHADRPRLRRGVRRLARRRHPRPRARDRGAGLHVAVRKRCRAQRHPDGDGGQPPGDDRRRPHGRAAHPGRHVRLRDRDPDAPVRLRRPRRARDAPPHPRAGRRPARDRARRSRRSRRPRTRSSASGGTTPHARRSGSRRRRSARATSRPARTGTS